jgi:hypothetical protein
MRRHAVALLAALVAVLVGTSSLASAAVTPKRSGIFAGYAVSAPSIRIKHVTATFVVPTITCQDTFSGVGPSVLVYSNVNPRTGAHGTSGAGIGVACSDGGPLYESVILINDHAYNDLSLSAGDTVDVSVQVVPAGTKVTIDDVTSGATKTRVGQGRSAVQTFIGDNSVVVDGESGKLDPFTTTQVSDALINSRRIGALSPYRFQWVKEGHTLVSASALQSGEDFTLTYRASD